MDELLRYYPIVLYVLASILLVVLIILGIKLIKAVDKTNEILTDTYNKTKSLNGFFNMIDTLTDTLSNLSDNLVSGISGVIGKIFHRRSKKEEDDWDV